MKARPTKPIDIARLKTELANELELLDMTLSAAIQNALTKTKHMKES